jgi:hypothetical protein
MGGYIALPAHQKGIACHKKNPLAGQDATRGTKKEQKGFLCAPE